MTIDRGRSGGAGALFRFITKVGISLIAGLVTYGVTQQFGASTEPATLVGLGVSIFISGVAFVVQFLIDADSRADAIADSLAAMRQRFDWYTEETRNSISTGFDNVSEATSLYGAVNASRLNTAAVTDLVRTTVSVIENGGPLIAEFAQREIDRLAGYLKALGLRSDVTYEAEDRDWLLCLTRVAKHSIDATSLTTVDGDGRGSITGGLWTSALGNQYLQDQQAAIHRGVMIRRIFIFDGPELPHDDDFSQILRKHAAIGVKVRILSSADLKGGAGNNLFDFIVFDNVLSYQAAPAAFDDGHPPTIVSTTLVTEVPRVQQRINRYRQLWELARDYVPLPRQPTLSDHQERALRPRVG